jgi:RHS repeat-associated protein
MAMKNSSTLSRMSFRLPLVYLLCTLSLLAKVSSAQAVDPVTLAQEPMPESDHSYIGRGSEIVNPADGTVNFELPIATPPGRGLSFPFGIRYSASEPFYLANNGVSPNFYWSSPANTSSQTPFELNGWSYELPNYEAQAYVVSSQPNERDTGTDYCWGTQNYHFRGLGTLQVALGASNYWPDSGNADQNVCHDVPTGVSSEFGVSGTFTNSGSSNQPSLTLTDRDGTVYRFPGGPIVSGSPTAVWPWGMLAQSITDRNGNQITLSGSQPVLNSQDEYQLQPGKYIDTAGRAVVSWSGLGSTSGDQITISGLSNNIVVKWTTTTATFPTGTQYVSGTASCGFSGAQSLSMEVVSEIDLPNGQKYSFTYGGTWGRLTQITFPDGGYVKYNWGTNSLSEASHQTWTPQPGDAQNCYVLYSTPAITDRYVSYNGSSTAFHQHFTYGTNWVLTGPGPIWSTKVTTVQNTDEVTNQTSTTQYTYSYVVPTVFTAQSWVLDELPVEKTIVYQDGSGNTLRTVNKTWYDRFFAIGDQTVLDNGQGMTTLRCPDVNDRVLGEYEYDFQSQGSKPTDPSCAALSTGTLSSGLNTAAIGPLLRQTATAYHVFTSNILDDPNSVTVSDGSGNQISQTTYSYDGGSLFTSNAATGFVGAPGQRGNVTAISHWLNTSSSLPTTTYAYYDTGQLESKTDPCGQPGTTCSDMTGSTQTTTYSYADSYSSGTAPGQTNAYLTKITDALQHSSTFTYSYNDGYLTSSTDPNTETTNYTYNTPPSWCSYPDKLDRLSQISYPDKGQTTYCYDDAAATVTTEKLIASGSPPLETTMVFDGMGHAVQTQLNSDPDGIDYVDTSYDGFGRVYTQSNPHRSSSLPTDGTTTYTYDALGRTTNITQPDGSAIATSYSGNSTTVTDEAGNQRISLTDGLARMTEVEEPSQGSGAPATATISVSGGIQSIQYPATPGTGTVSISGGERSTEDQPASCSTSWTEYDGGTVSVSVNGHATTADYGTCSTGSSGISTAAGVASSLAAAINADSGAFVTAVATNGQVALTTKSTGTSTAYSFSGTSATSCGLVNACTNQRLFASGSTSFPVGVSGSTLTAGQNSSTAYDYGTVSATVNGCTASASYSESGNNTGAAIASALAASLSGTCSSQVSATASGSTITLTTTSTGPFADNDTLSVTSATSDSSQFSSPSFTASATGFSGGSDFGGTTSPWTTFYTYNALDDLTGVTQNGSDSSTARVRTFQYDSLSRLTLATNPESGTLNYTYDANGNVATRIAPAPNQTGTATLTTTYKYDVLDRLTSKTYSDGTTPGAHFLYDVAPSSWTNPSVTLANIVGRMTEAYTDGTTWSGSVFGYDPMGRVNINNQCTPGTCGTKNYAVAYLYDLLGDMTQSSNGFTTFTYTPYDGAGRPTGITSSLVDTQHPATLLTVNATAGYWPNGGLRSHTYGNGLTESSVYNNRLQPCRLNLNSSATILSTCADQIPSDNVQDFNIAYGSTGNNGNIVSMLATGTQAFVRGFTYDRVDRLLTMTNSSSSESCGGLQWTYDAWGNRTNQKATSGSCFQSSAAATVNNQLVGYTYDAAGNLINNSGTTYYYDAENRLIQVNGTLGTCSTATQCYGYDAMGRRTEKLGTSSWNDRIYNLSDQVVAQAVATGGFAAYIYLNRSLVAQYGNNTTYFVQTDQLGSTRTMTCFASGTTGCSASQAVYDSMDFMPFGEQILGDGGSIHKFTGKERDSESGNDYFGARYYGSSLGRFMTPDWAAKPISVPYANFGNPQSLNLYSYVQNNPTTLGDPDGHCPPCDGDFWDFVGGVVNAYGSDNLLGAGRVDQSTTSGRVGAAVGDFAATVQGGAETLFGGGVEVGGVALDATGVGAVVGVPANVAGAGLMLHGGSTAEQGLSNLFKSAMSPKEGEIGGPGAGKDFPDKTKQEAVAENQAANGGQAKCVFCTEDVGPGTDNKINIDHAKAKAKRGNNSLNNANVTCEYCNKSKGTGDAPKNPKCSTGSTDCFPASSKPVGLNP